MNDNLIILAHYEADLKGGRDHSISARLSPNQRNILAAIAYESVSEPYSQEFSEKVRIGVSSIKKSLDILLRDDLVYKDKEGIYKVVDPAIEGYLHQIRYFDFLDND